MKKTYLITGGTGFIGAALVKRLVNENHHVKVLDNNARGALRRLGDFINHVEFVEADIRDANAVKKAAAGVDCIAHLAYINGTEFFYTQPELVLDVGVRGMLNVLDACRANNIGDLIVASSSEVYQTPPTTPTDETAPLIVPDVLNPRYSYGGGKIISELLAINYGRNNFDRVSIFRPHNVYGPDMGWEHVLPEFILRTLQLMQENPQGPIEFPIQGDGLQTRAFIHIDDFTDGLLNVIEQGEHLNIYHIGNPEEVSIKAIAEKVIAYFGREGKIITGEAMPGGTLRRCPDISKLRKLGFEPNIMFDDGLASIADWYKENSHLQTTNKMKETVV